MSATDEPSSGGDHGDERYTRMWAPWRLGYIKGQGDESPPTPPEPVAWLDGHDADCFICRAGAEYAPADVEAADRAMLVVARGEHTVTLLNRYPYANAHLLVCPRRHVGTLAELSDAEHLEASRELARWTALLERVVNATGFNVGLNLGAVAGAGVPGHLHWHLLPRWPGDHNFLPTTAGVRVIPQSLDATWSLLRDAAGSGGGGTA